jgi:hypothetical protein
MGHAALLGVNLISADGWLVHVGLDSLSPCFISYGTTTAYLIASSSTWSGSPIVWTISDPLLLHHSVLDPRPDILFNITVSAGVLTAVKLFSHSLGAAFPPAFSFLVLGSARQRGDPSIMGRVVYCLVVEGG